MNMNVPRDEIIIAVMMLIINKRTLRIITNNSLKGEDNICHQCGTKGN